MLLVLIINLRSCDVINLCFIGRWNSQLLYPIHSRYGGRAAKIFAENMGLRCIPKEVIPSRTSWYTQQTETPSHKRVELSTGSSVAGQTVKKNK